MKQRTHSNVQAGTPLPAPDHGAQPISDQDLDAVSGSGISGVNEARKLLDEYLASMDILSRRTDLSNDQKAALRGSLAAELTRKIDKTVAMLPAA
jgi:hypothetical protein